MLSPMNVVQTQTVPAAVIPLSIPRSEIRNVMGPAMQELMAQVPTRGLGRVQRPGRGRGAPDHG
jgi:hypothetical protein